MRVLFLGSPQEVVPVLQYLRQSSAFNESHQLVGIVSQPARPTGRGGKLSDPPVATFARAADIPLLQPETVKDPEFIAAMKALAPDVAITAAFGQILTNEFLSILKRGTINIHPSLLPRHRGAVPVPAALLAGEKETGVTVLFTVRKLDAGNLILQEKTPIGESETSADLLARLFVVGAAMIPQALEKLEDPLYIGDPQNESEATHCRKIEKDDGNIDWEKSGETILNSFRAYEPWPGSFTYLGDRRLAVVSMKPVRSADLPTQAPNGPGHVIFDKKLKSLLVGTGTNDQKGAESNGLTFVAVTEIRPAGGKTMDAAGFWNGLKIRDHVQFTRESKP